MWPPLRLGRLLPLARWIVLQLLQVLLRLLREAEEETLAGALRGLQGALLAAPAVNNKAGQVKSSPLLYLQIAGLVLLQVKAPYILSPRRRFSCIPMGGRKMVRQATLTSPDPARTARALMSPNRSFVE